MKHLIVLIFFLPIFLFGQMALLYPKLPNDFINELHYINNEEVIFINEAGSIYKSYDGGNSWDLKQRFPNYRLKEMHFLDSQTGFIKTVRKSNNIVSLIYTTDGGENWRHQNITLNHGTPFLPLSESIMIKSTPDGEIFLLDNFYNYWDTTYVFKSFILSDFEFGNYEVPYGYITQFEKLPSKRILALGINKYAFSNEMIKDSLSLILKSDDEGTSWDTLWTGFPEFVENISFNSDSIGWMNTYTPAAIYKTIDGGHSWADQDIEGLSWGISDLFAYSEAQIYALSDRNNPDFITYDDKEDKWQIKPVGFKGQFKINFSDKTNGFLFGSKLLKTNNSGESWQQFDSSFTTNIFDIDFVTLDKGFALGRNGLYVTENGGHSWEKLFSPHPPNFQVHGNLEMLSTAKGFFVSDDTLYKTIDAGENWDTVSLSNKKQKYKGIEFYDGNLGILYSVSEEKSPNVYAAKNHYLTANGGENWEPIDIAPDTISTFPGYYQKMQFTDPQHLWAMNQQGLWHSADTAKSWQHVFAVDYFTGGYSFDFYNSKIGILTRAGDLFYFTNDGGISWQTIQKASYNNPTDCKILGPDYSGRYRILETGQGGNLLLASMNKDGLVFSNRKLDTYTNNDLNSIFVLEQENFPNVWIGGNGFSIFYRQWELIYSGLEETIHSPKKFVLQQNYPNPFNPSTKIEFSLKESSKVQLIVFDSQGKKVVELVNKFMTHGAHEVSFDATNLPSGVYFYRLIANKFNQARKMLYLK
jgi:photosystem II stability/assembly factor-like uncharacterized protein